ncbi:MAG TPA: 30S ribosomal protein S12 methylthiotransferase RimO [Chitinophagales bacterium]|nr:30S ribosomal protein S12 methylthiotransferase RimO [Chitinophagales bacterium]
MKTKSLRQDKVDVITLGCSKNLVDSEVLVSQLLHNEIQAEHSEGNTDANIVVINTCGFIDKAKEESINTILHFADKKERGEIDKLFVTGCLSQRYKDDLEVEIPSVDGYFGTLEMPQLLERFNVDYQHELIGERSISTPQHFAYLKISEGCNRTCSFCAIPLMRGEHISRSIESLVQEAKNLAKVGVKELILIAQELTYYGLDLYKKRALDELLFALNEVEGIEWIRLHYAYPSKFPLEILDAIAQCDKVCDYLDIPFQHASDNVLKRMRRQVTRAEQTELIQQIRTKVPNIALRTTMLVGFPGETDEDFEDLCDFVREMQFERLGVFTYSHEENTIAHQYEDDISEEVKQERAQILMSIQEEISFEKNSEKIGQTFKVLIDRKESGNYIGRTEFDSPEVDNEVLIPTKGNYLRIGDFAQIEIVDATEFDLFGTLVK